MAEGEKSVGVGLVETSDVGAELVAPATVEIDYRFETGPVHEPEKFYHVGG